MYSPLDLKPGNKTNKPSFVLLWIILYTQNTFLSIKEFQNHDNFFQFNETNSSKSNDFHL